MNSVNLTLVNKCRDFTHFFWKKFSLIASKVNCITMIRNSTGKSRWVYSLCESFFKTILENAYFVKHLCEDNKAILILLLWQCVNNLTYYLLLEPSFIVQHLDIKTVLGILFVEAILSLFSPLAGVLADVRFGRFEVLKWSTYIMIAFESIDLVCFVVISAVVDRVAFTFYLMIALHVIALSGYFLGRVLFLANVIQFGTDQLRDSPTHYSVFYIHMFFWSNSFSDMVSKLLSSLARHDSVLDSHNKIVNINSTQFLLFEICLSISAIFSVVILLIIQKYSNYFFNEKIRGNPYKLVFSVIRFAIKHKQPIRRSAFTYCDDEHPSRIDYGKQIYGGPFTTEQVEDVKSLLSIGTVLISLGPAFLLDFTALTVFNHHSVNQNHLSRNPYTDILLNKGILSPLLIFICIPFFVLLIKPYFARLIPNMFKRMGLSIVIMNILFLLYLVYSSIGRYDSKYAIGDQCSGNTSYILHMELVEIPYVSLPILQQILSPLYQMLLYIAAGEFICCQSPQHMKGLVFGLFYFIKAFFQLLSAIISCYFFIHWKLQILNCQSVYFLFNLAVGLLSLCVFVAMARKYKYRKRDDICNIYQYAENYYSNIP